MNRTLKWILAFVGLGLLLLIRTRTNLISQVPGEEDFGITPLEAAASGVPTIAYGRGGALETIVGLDDESRKTPTGVFFEEQSVDSLIGALSRFEENEHKFIPGKLREHALIFDKSIFRKRIKKVIEQFFTP